MADSLKLNPATILSQYSNLGFCAINFLYGKHYFELYRSFFQLGFMQYSLYFDDWKSPEPMDYGYTPDMYDLILNGESCLHYKSPHVFEDTPMREIHITGGLEDYLKRLNSKKRSEFRRCNTAVASSMPIIASDAMRRIRDDICEKHYEELASKGVSGWFDGSHNTRLASVYLVSYLQQEKGLMEDRTARSFLLPIFDRDTEDLICYTHCVSSMDDRVLYCLVDTNRSDKYSAKAVTVANIEWACANGYDYVDIDNHIYQEGLFELLDPSSIAKIAYKNMFFTGVPTRKTYFSSAEALETFKAKRDAAIQAR